MRERRLAPRSVNLRIAALKSFFKLMAPERAAVMQEISKVKEPRSLPGVLSQQEVLRMIAATGNLKHRAIIMLLYSSGLRLRELLNLKITHIESDRMKIRVEQGKGKADRYTILANRTLDTLREYFRAYRPQEHLWEGRHRRPYSARSFGKIVENAARAARIGKNVHPHMLRHSFATHLMESGVALPVIQQLLGHTSIKTTMIYLHVGQPSMDKIVSPLDREPEVAHG